MRPGIDWPATVGRHWDWYVSVTSYVGPVVVVLGGAQPVRGWRWWHTLVLITGWLAIGSRNWYQPSYWLADWPFIGSAHVVTRWRFVAMLGIGLAAGSVLARWRASGQRVKATLAAAAVVVIAADYLALASGQVSMAFSVAPDRRSFPEPAVREIVNVGDGIGYPCVLRGYGVIRGYEPMLSYHRDAPTLRKARGEPGYRGESWTDEGGIRPVYWSPNRLIFRARPGQEVFINQNPGSWWMVNGRRAFEGLRCRRADAAFRREGRRHGPARDPDRSAGIGVRDRPAPHRGRIADRGLGVAATRPAPGSSRAFLAGISGR